MADLPSEIAVNIAGVEYVCGSHLSAREKPTTFYAGSLSSSKITPEITIEAQLPTEVELQGRSTGAGAATKTFPRVLWVGLAPTSAPEVTEKKKVEAYLKQHQAPSDDKVKTPTTSRRNDMKAKRGTGLSQQSPSKSTVSKVPLRLPYDSGALRVVVKIEDHKPSAQMKLYALYGDPSEAPCGGIPLPASHVFWFEEFHVKEKEEDKGKKSRAKKATEADIKANIYRHIAALAPGTSGNREADKLENPAAFVSVKGGSLILPPQRSLCLAIEQLLRLYQSTKSPYYLDEARKILEKEDPSLEYRLPDANYALHDFLNSTVSISSELASKVLSELRYHRPSLNLTPACLTQIRRAMEQLGKTPLYTQIHSFFGIFQYLFAKGDDQDIVDLTRETMNILEAGMIGDQVEMESPVALADSSSYYHLLHTIKDKIKEIVSLGRSEITAINDELGTGPVADSTDTLAGKYAEKSDLDSARAYIQQLARLLMAAGQAETMTTTDCLEKLLDELEALLAKTNIVEDAPRGEHGEGS